MTEATARALSAPRRSSADSSAGSSSSSRVRAWIGRSGLDHGVAGVLLQRAVLGVAVGDVVGLAVVERGEDLQQVADAGLGGRVVAHLVLRVGDRPLELAGDHGRVVEQPDQPGVGVGRLRHLRRRVLQVHHPPARRRRDRHREHERVAEAPVEADGDVTRDLDVLALVVADRHLVGVVEQDVGRLQRRVGEQAAGDELAGALLGLVLELDHPRQLAVAHVALHQPGQLGVLGDVALHEHRRHLGVETDAEERRRQLQRALRPRRPAPRSPSGRGGRRCRGTRPCRAGRAPTAAAPRGSCPDGRRRSAACTKGPWSRRATLAMAFPGHAGHSLRSPATQAVPGRSLAGARSLARSRWPSTTVLAFPGRGIRPWRHRSK